MLPGYQAALWARGSQERAHDDGVGSRVVAGAAPDLGEAVRGVEAECDVVVAPDVEVDDLAPGGACGAEEVAEERLLPVIAGGLYSADQFYNPDPEVTSTLADYGVLGVEMEAAALYTLAAQFSRRALALCTVSDHLLTGEETSAMERQESFEDMIVVALESVVRLDRDRG